MDAESRHHLKQNELAQALANLRSLADPRTRNWLIAIVAVLAIWIGYKVWRFASAQSLEREWTRLAAIAPKPEGETTAYLDELRALIADSSNPALLAGARLRLANELLTQVNTGAGNREPLVREAITILEQVITPETPDTFVAAATFAAARAHESLRELDQAQARYRALVDEPRFAGSAFRGLAEESLKTLDELAVVVQFEPGEPPAPPPATIEPATQPTSERPQEPQPAADQTRTAGEKPSEPGPAPSTQPAPPAGDTHQP